MSVSVKALIFIFSLWVSMTAICNWFDGQTDILTASDVAVLASAGEVLMVESTEETGESSSFFQWGENAMEAVNKILFFKYSFWFDTYTGYTESTCIAAGGYEFDEGNSLCRFANSWAVVWFWFFRPLGIAFLIAFVSIGVGILRGR